MAKVFTPSFKVATPVVTKFSTNNPLGEDRKSLPVTIVELTFNEATRSIQATGSDMRMRQCRIDRMNDTKMVQALTKQLQNAYDNGTKVCFVAAGANDPNVWFYSVLDSI